jgi:arsenite-transporting ATPase
MAVRLRNQNPTATVAVCSTDPAPSLDDVFGQEVGAQLEPLSEDARLVAAEIDAPAEFHAWAARMNDRIAGALSTSSGGVHIDLSFERQLFSALLDVVPPGLDEVFGVLRVSELVQRKTANFLILDMAPTGHALEMLRTPDRILHWSRLLLKTLATHRTLPFARDVGAEIAKFSSDVRWLTRQLRNKDAAAAWVVMLAEPMPDRETARLLNALQELGVGVRGIVVNRVLLQPAAQCRRCQLRVAWQRSSLVKLKKGATAGVPIYCVAEQGHGISGVDELQRFIEQIWRLA